MIESIKIGATKQRRVKIWFTGKRQISFLPSMAKVAFNRLNMCAIHIRSRQITFYSSNGECRRKINSENKSMILHENISLIIKFRVKTASNSLFYLINDFGLLFHAILFSSFIAFLLISSTSYTLENIVRRACFKLLLLDHQLYFSSHKVI